MLESFDVWMVMSDGIHLVALRLSRPWRGERLYCCDGALVDADQYDAGNGFSAQRHGFIHLLWPLL